MGTERLRLHCSKFSVLGLAWSLDGTKIFASDIYSTIIRAWDAWSGELFDIFDRGGSGGGGIVLLGILERPVGDKDDRARARLADAAGWQLSQARARRLTQVSIEAIESPHAPDYARGLGFPDEARSERIWLARGADNEVWIIPRTMGGTRLGVHLPGSGLTMNNSLDHVAAFTPDDRTLALSLGSIIRLWDIERRQARDLEGHRKPVRSLSFSPNGKTLASGGHDGLVCLWDLAREGELARFDWNIGMIDAVAFSPDGSTVAAGGRTGIVVWDVAEDAFS